MPEKDISSTKERQGMWVLISEWFQPKEEQRRAELQRALNENLECEEISKVILFAETKSGLPSNHPRLVILEPSKRPSYNDLFRFANKQLPDENVIIANNDISFSSFKGPAIEEGDFFVVSRYEVINEQEVWFDDAGYDFPHSHSADAWIFRSPCKVKGAHFKMGQAGCDNRIAWLAEASGCNVRNVGRECRTRHYHESQVRKEAVRTRVTSPYMLVGVDGAKEVMLKVGRRELVRSALVDWACFRFTLSYIFGGRAKVPKTT